MTMYYVWLCMAVYDYVLCMPKYDFVWLHMTMPFVSLYIPLYDSVWLCMTMHDFIRERETEREWENDRDSNSKNFVILLQKFSNH